jgi:hypothetical protein
MVLTFVYVFCTYLETICDFYVTYHQMIGFFKLRWRVFTARYALSLYISMCFVFKGLTKLHDQTQTHHTR